jgi:uncharacterized protein (UPF0335 family)
MIDIEELRQALGAVQPEKVLELIDRIEAAEKERDALRALVVMRFDHDHPPQFTQGYDPHELNEPVTAEHCRWFVDEIERLRAKLEAAERERDVAQQLVQSEIGKREISEAHNTVTRRLSVLADENAALRSQIEAIHSLLDGVISRI